MTDRPTTENGQLHTPDVTLDNRLIQASLKRFSTRKLRATVSLRVG